MKLRRIYEDYEYTHPRDLDSKTKHEIIVKLFTLLKDNGVDVFASGLVSVPQGIDYSNPKVKNIVKAIFDI